MKKKNEEKQQKILKIIKIIGCSLGLLLCGGAFISLLVIGIRGCVSQSNKKVVSETTLKENVINYDVGVKRLVSDDYTYYYNYPLYGYNSDILDYMTSSGSASLLSNPGTIQIGDEISSFIGVSYTVGYQTNLFKVTFSSATGTLLDYSAQLDQNEDFTLLYVRSTIFGIQSYYPNYNGLPALNDIKIKFNGDVNNAVLETFINCYFSTKPLDDTKNVAFNSVINPFGPIGVNYDYFTTSNLSGAYTLATGLFKDSEGTFYNAIMLHYLSAQGMRYGTPTDYQTYTGVGSHYMTMSFIRVKDGHMITVNAQDYSIATSGSDEGNVVMIKSNHWISSLYQYITVFYLNEDNYSIGNSLSRLGALTSLNNASGYSGVTGVGGIVGSTGLFDLIGSAFMSLVPILNTQVLPGVNLWTLLLVPLLGSIVLFVVWLFKR